MEPGLQPRRLVSGQFTIIRDSSSPAKQVIDLVAGVWRKVRNQIAESLLILLVRAPGKR